MYECVCDEDICLLWMFGLMYVEFCEIVCEYELFWVDLNDEFFIWFLGGIIDEIWLFDYVYLIIEGYCVIVDVLFEIMVELRFVCCILGWWMRCEWVCNEYYVLLGFVYFEYGW